MVFTFARKRRRVLEVWGGATCHDERDVPKNIFANDGCWSGRFPSGDPIYECDPAQLASWLAAIHGREGNGQRSGGNAESGGRCGLQASRIIAAGQYVREGLEEGARRCGIEESFRALHASGFVEQAAGEGRICAPTW